MSADSVDVDLTKVLKNTTQTRNKSESDIVRYLCNYAFSDIINPCKNVKFPGTMVVSLGREDIKKIKGSPRIHKPYATEEIVVWISPVTRQIPPLNFQTTEKPTNIMKARRKKIRFNTNNIEFGDYRGFFDYINPVFTNVKNIEFGDSKGVFEPFHITWEIFSK